MISIDKIEFCLAFFAYQRDCEKNVYGVQLDLDCEMLSQEVGIFKKTLLEKNLKLHAENWGQSNVPEVDNSLGRPAETFLLFLETRSSC